MILNNKKIGLGSISLLLSIIGILFSFSFGDNLCYGDVILNYIGLKPWSNGNTGLHYTVIYSLIFFIPAFILGYKYKNNFGAKIGKIVSLIMIIFILVVFPIFGAISFQS
ncbi:hypothetical protein R0131_17625 [Clostridium sp. AL.422]|uniref:hypothetical protein n=1 Tax=Clostridium TaxID=1485 RepID=UPI00293DE3B3|nr:MULTISPECIES: hypothetical protein [unclassified Clostridium]MDV4152651.1 hypothetical protein [Clostridium sp. AL.422]